MSLVLSQLDCENATLAGIPDLLSQLQAVINAGARLIFNGDRHDHITPLLRQLHWLRVPDQITFKLAIMMFQCVNGTASGYLSSDVRCVAGLPGRKHLRSAASTLLAIPATRRSLIADRAFVVAAASVRNKFLRISDRLQRYLLFDAG